MQGKKSRAIPYFFLLLAFATLANGLSDAVYGNYFKEVFHVTASQRAFIELPRELPGLLCALVIAALSLLGDFKISILAQLAACAGVTALGLFTPSYAGMLVFLFLNSMGMHLFMPLQDSIGMRLSEPERVGKRMGQYASVKSVFATFASLAVFFGFRSGAFSFTPTVVAFTLAGKSVRLEILPIFLLSGALFVCALASACLLSRACAGQRAPARDGRKLKLVFRWEYRYFYLLTLLHGVQKQIAYVFGAWVVIDLLGKGADVIAILGIAASFSGIFFMSFIGKWMDKFGVRRMMAADALTFIVIYIVYGLVVWNIVSRVLPGAEGAQGGWIQRILYTPSYSVMAVYALFVLDRLSMQMGIVKSVYLRAIARSPEEVTPTLSLGTSLDHVVAILAAQVSGAVWETWGPQWVFFIAAAFSLGNLYVAIRARPAPPPDKRREEANA